MALVIECFHYVFPVFKIELAFFCLQDDYGDERETNLAAVFSAAAQWGGLKMVIKAGISKVIPLIIFICQ